MSKISLTICLFLAMIYVCPASFGQKTGYKPKASIYGVVVGISDYRDSKIPDLHSAEKDANEFYNMLLSPILGAVPKENISLVLGPKATRANVINEVVKTFRKANSEDMIIFYFSGHGKKGESEENGYLLGYDTEDGDEPGSAISMEELKTKIDNSKAKLKLTYVDACHAGLFKKPGTKGTNDDEGLPKIIMEGILNANAGSAVFLASKPNQNSQENEKVGGVFTHFLINGLKGEADKSRPGTPGFDNKIVTVGEMETFLTEKISKFTNFQQQPFIEYSCEEDFPLSILDPSISLPDAIGKADGKKKPGGPIVENRGKPTTNNTTPYGDEEPISKGECITTYYTYGKYYFVNNFGEPLILYYTSRPGKKFTLPIPVGEKVMSPLVYVSRINKYVPTQDVDYTEFYFRTQDETKPILYGTLLLPVKVCTTLTKILTPGSLVLSVSGKRVR